MMRYTLIVGLSMVFGLTHTVAKDMAYENEIKAWRQTRLENLKKSDGWLSLVGLHWLSPGTQRVGRAVDNDIVLTIGPKYLGQIHLEKQIVRLRYPDGEAAANEILAPNEIDLHPDTASNPTQIPLGQEGTLSLIERSGRYALRVKDSAAKTRTEFSGLDYFPIQPDFRIEARYEAHPPGKTLEIASVINTIEAMPNPGALVFVKDGVTHRLETIDEGDGPLFVIFADRTNGKTTYGPGRFVYVDLPKEGKAILDFNKAYNPPCAFNAYSTCPLPPPQNRLDLEVTAGEKKYRATAARMKSP
jgi:uncharacterized protein (DUF1684 family)